MFHDLGVSTASCLRRGRCPCAGPAAPRVSLGSQAVGLARELSGWKDHAWRLAWQFGGRRRRGGDCYRCSLLQLALARQLDATVEKSGGPQGTTVSIVAGAAAGDASSAWQVLTPLAGRSQ